MVMVRLVVPEETEEEMGQLNGCADQNLWEGWINFSNELEKARRFANFMKNVGNRTIFRHWMRTRCISLWPHLSEISLRIPKFRYIRFSGVFSNPPW
jgi:hypothetical protein